MREYIIFEDRPSWPVGGRRFNAYPTFGKSFGPPDNLRDVLPPTVMEYDIIDAPNKPEAVKAAKQRWA